MLAGPAGSPQLPFPAALAVRGLGMSIGALIKGDAVLPVEVSLTRTPAFEDAGVLAVGGDALATFELLTKAAPGRQVGEARLGRRPAGSKDPYCGAPSPNLRNTSPRFSADSRVSGWSSPRTRR